MSSTDSAMPPLGESIISRVAAIVTEAEQTRRPIEMEPYRSQLFEVFVTADGAGLLAEDASPKLTAESLCEQLGQRWGLTNALRESAQKEERLAQDQLGKMKLLWSVLRMWIEWQYAWSRWREFHEE